MNSKRIIFSLYFTSNFFILIINAISWNGNRGNGCDFIGNDLSLYLTNTANDCESLCLKTTLCTHYVWQTIGTFGICKMKKGPISRSNAVSTSNDKVICGIVNVGSSASPPTNAPPTCKFIQNLHGLTIFCPLFYPHTQLEGE